MIGVAVLWSDRLGIAATGRAMARAFGTSPKHSIKQVDRCLSNEKITPRRFFPAYVEAVLGDRTAVEVSLDWTEFDHDDHSTLSIGLVTRCKRATPLVWKTVKKSKLKGRQRKYERDLLREFNMYVPDHVIDVVVIADRGFGDVALYRYIHDELGFHYIIRFRENVYIQSGDWLHPAGHLVPRNGRARILHRTTVTCRQIGPFTVVLCKKAGMKNAWCLATSLDAADGERVVALYGRRFGCEESFRDIKDRRYGYGLRSTQIQNEQRRDRFLMLFALAYLIYTVLGACSEELGFDRNLRANTVGTRTHSLFNQGRALLGLLPADKHARLKTTFQQNLRAILREGLHVAL